METFLKVYGFIFGSIVGSFLNVVIYRLPLKKDLVKPRSACPECGNQLKWFHNIPILSYVFLAGKCSFCKTGIPLRYPLIEILTGLLALWLAPANLSPEQLLYFFFHFGIGAVFICHFFIDLDHHLLLDSLNIYLLVLVFSFVVLTFHWQYWLIGGAIGFLAPLLVTWLFYKLRGQIGLGGGDIKLFGILGLYLGPLGIIYNIFFSCMIGAVFGIILILFQKMDRSKPMAFGPFIIVVAAWQIFFPELFTYVADFLR
ncbi:MAG: prepilin peptidase [Bacteriovoracaceae bacterium]